MKPQNNSAGSSGRGLVLGDCQACVRNLETVVHILQPFAVVKDVDSDMLKVRGGAELSFVAKVRSFVPQIVHASCKRMVFPIRLEVMDPDTYVVSFKQ